MHNAVINYYHNLRMARCGYLRYKVRKYFTLSFEIIHRRRLSW